MLSVASVYFPLEIPELPPARSNGPELLKLSSDDFGYWIKSFMDEDSFKSFL